LVGMDDASKQDSSQSMMSKIHASRLARSLLAQAR
jgi:hypothetical protein